MGWSAHISATLAAWSIGLRRLAAQYRYGTPMAVSAEWRRLYAAEAAERAKHKSVKHLQERKAQLVRQALEAGR